MTACVGPTPCDECDAAHLREDVKMLKFQLQEAIKELHDAEAMY